jgi:hypothetical protein
LYFAVNWRSGGLVWETVSVEEEEKTSVWNPSRENILTGVGWAGYQDLNNSWGEGLIMLTKFEIHSFM